jgi:hypothetical protein
MRVYVAAASSEIERAEKWMARLREAGVEVVSTWPEVIRKVGAANPMEASREERAGWASADLSELSSANVLWLLLPEKPTSGMWIEYGYGLCFGAVAKEAREAGVEGAPKFQIVSSGIERSIFTALAPNYESDEVAFEMIVAQRGTIAAQRGTMRLKVDPRAAPFFGHTIVGGGMSGVAPFDASRLPTDLPEPDQTVVLAALRLLHEQLRAAGIQSEIESTGKLCLVVRDHPLLMIDYDKHTPQEPYNIFIEGQQRRTMSLVAAVDAISGELRRFGSLPPSARHGS